MSTDAKVEEIEEKLVEAVEQLVDWKLQLEKGIPNTCGTGIPWIAHEVELMSTAEKDHYKLHLNFGVRGFWICGHDVAVTRDDEGEE